MIDFNFENKQKLSPGSVLISEPFLDDDYFSRSVIFLCEHNEDGSFGFVLNKYVENEIAEMIGEFPKIDSKLGVGGPVDTSHLFYLHSLGERVPNSTIMANGLSIGGKFESVKELINLDPSLIKSIRFFIGYSGWDNGQLEKELEQKSWIVLNGISNDLIMDSNNDEIWKDIMQKLGGKFKVMSKFPKNPSDN